MDTIVEVLSKYGEVVKQQYVNDIKNKPATKYGPANASGKLANSVRLEVDEKGLRLYALGYSYFVENGRGPNKKQPTARERGLYGIGNAVRQPGELQQAIEQWITDKGIVSDISKKSLAFLIARKIAREGTEAYKQGGTRLLGDIITPDLINSIKSDIFLLMKTVMISQMRKAYEPLKMAA